MTDFSIAALTAARRYCGWHVTPEEDTTVTVDGPGGHLLVLPTLRLLALTSVTEDGTAVDVSTLEWSPRGLVRKRSGGYWSSRLGAITVTMSHGFADAGDFDTAMFSIGDRLSFAGNGGRPRVVGPVQWDSETMDSSSAFSIVERSLLDQYRLESPA